MTNPPNIDAIIAELSEATGPSRELDAHIEVATAGFPEAVYQRKNAMRPRGAPPLDRMTWLTGWGVPRFTSSLDDAMTLVPPKTLWAVGSMEDGPFARMCAPMRGGTYVGGYIEATAATVELASVIAALRVRSALIGEVGRDG